MKALKHNGMVYAVLLEHGELAFVFKTEIDALNYCKDRYPNTIFQILPVPVFIFNEENGDEK